MALSLLVAHAIIPSLATTGHIGPRVERVRPLFYAAAVAAAAIALFALFGFVTESDVLRTIYTKVWI
jgi:arginine exporter protein ArgO